MDKNIAIVFYIALVWFLCVGQYCYGIEKGWKRYVWKDFKVEITIPESWKITSKASSNNHLEIEYDDLNDESIKFLVAAGRADIVIENKFVLEGFIKEAMKSLAKKEGFNLVEDSIYSTPDQVNNIGGASMEGKVTEDNRTVFMYLFIGFYKRNMYQIAFMYEIDKKYESKRAVMNKILRNIRAYEENR